MFDCQSSELVTITVEFAVAFATLFVENEHLFAFYERRDDFANHFGSFYYGSAHGDVTFVVYQQYCLKFNSLAAFCCRHVVDEELFAFLSLELLTVNLYDCVHFKLYKRFFPGGVPHPRSLLWPHRTLNGCKITTYF